MEDVIRGANSARVEEEEAVGVVVAVETSTEVKLTRCMEEELAALMVVSDDVTAGALELSVQAPATVNNFFQLMNPN